ncbi:MAG: ABC transporter permease subunit [Planctomycetota bacterium]|nr:MAG: ABC transporter permease subunit [Planctomycetota bacterium]
MSRLAPPPPSALLPRRGRGLRDACFVVTLFVVGGSYVLLLAALLGADLRYVAPDDFHRIVQQPETQAAARLTFLTSTVAAVIAVWVATPLAYLLSRFRFPGRVLVDLLVDIPLVLPPLVMGLSLLILFHVRIGEWQLEAWLQQTFGWRVTYEVPAIILAQFTVICGLAVRTLRTTFDMLPVRTEQVARTLGCSRYQVFRYVVLPQAGRGLFTAFVVAWARAVGEFGPILVFASATRFRTEVLSTSVFLELNHGDLGAAVATSLFLLAVALLTLVALRLFGLGGRV